MALLKKFNLVENTVVVFTSEKDGYQRQSSGEERHWLYAEKIG